MQLFGSLKVLMALLGSSCPLLGRSGPKMGPKMGPKSGPKSDQKVVQKMTPKITKKVQILGPKMGPQICNFGKGAAQAEPAGALLKALVFKMAPRWLKMAPRSPR